MKAKWTMFLLFACAFAVHGRSPTFKIVDTGQDKNEVRCEFCRW